MAKKCHASFNLISTSVFSISIINNCKERVFTVVNSKCNHVKSMTFIGEGVLPWIGI